MTQINPSSQTPAAFPMGTSSPGESPSRPLTNNKIEVLFVDDERILLEGIRRMLKSKEEIWNMDFVSCGKEALEKLDTKYYDIVVSDMRMPEMDGVELLKEIRERHPDVIRIVLSSFSEKDMILRSVGVAHHYLSKPFSAAGIEETIARALSVKGVLADKRLQTLVAKIDKLPSLPELYRRLMDEISQDDPDNNVVSKIIQQDIAMTAKILQIINSAFFGLRRSITDVPDAVRMLGTDTVKSLALSVGVFSQLKLSKEFVGELNQIWQHSTEVALTAKAISTHEGSAMTDEAFTVGFLHDVGTLVMMLNLPGLYQEVRGLTEEEGLDRTVAETAIYGTDHGAIGAYLLGLWGLPWNMIEAVAFYPNPGRHSYRSFRPLTALHVAHVLCENKEASLDEIVSKLDTEYLEKIGSINLVPDWYELFHMLRDMD